jgi:DNA-directed RNA polymerase subunit omega
MARITVEDCLEKIESQYDLVLLAKERTSQLNSGAEMLVEADNDKNTVIALREIGDGKITIEELKNNSIAKLRKEPDSNLEEEKWKKFLMTILTSNTRERFQKAVWLFFLLKE